MAKFKVGDVVRVTAEYDGPALSRLCNGTAAIIIRIEVGWMHYVRTFTGEMDSFLVEDLEHLDDPPV